MNNSFFKAQLSERNFSDNCAAKALLYFYADTLKEQSGKFQDRGAHIRKIANSMQYNSILSGETKETLKEALHSFICELSRFEGEEFTFQSELDDEERQIFWGNPLKIKRIDFEVSAFGYCSDERETYGKIKNLIIYDDEGKAEAVYLKNLNQFLEYGNDLDLVPPEFENLTAKFQRFFVDYYNFRKELDKIKEIGKKHKRNTV